MSENGSDWPFWATVLFFSIRSYQCVHLLPALCPELTDPENGQVTWTGLTPGSTATYSCDDGYALDGAQNRTCQDNDTWTSQPPSCIGTYVCACLWSYEGMYMYKYLWVWVCVFAHALFACPFISFCGLFLVLLFLLLHIWMRDSVIKQGSDKTELKISSRVASTVSVTLFIEYTSPAFVLSWIMYTISVYISIRQA